MIFVISKALNDLYGFDAQNVKLNLLCAKYAHDCFIDYTSAKIHLSQTIDIETTNIHGLKKPCPTMNNI